MADQKLVGTHSGITTKFMYWYANEPRLIKHGCVRVQNKEKLSRKASTREAEWGTIVHSQIELSDDDGEGVRLVEINASTPDGLHYVYKPPDLTIESDDREAFDSGYNPDVSSTTVTHA